MQNNLFDGCRGQNSKEKRERERDEGRSQWESTVVNINFCKHAKHTDSTSSMKHL